VDNDKTISTLNDLIAICKDGQQGFKTAADHAKGAAVKALFADYSLRCGSGAAELQGQVISLGGKPSDSGTAGVFAKKLSMAAL
jgi:uncharacterized protein (TIGR02284 family)